MTETPAEDSPPEPPERSPGRRLRAALLALAVMLLGAIPAFTGLDHPPQAGNADEWHFVPVAMRTANSPDLDPGYYLNPTGPIYLYAGWIGVDYVTGRVSGKYRDTTDLAVAYLVDPARFYRWGRILSALAGLLAAGLLCYGVCRLFGNLPGLLAGLMAGSCPLIQSKMHSAIDEPMLLLVGVATMLATLAAVKHRSVRWFAASCVLLGLTVGVKYNGATLGLPWLLAVVHMLRNGTLRWRHLAWAAVGPVVFLVTSPHALLNTREFVEQVAWSKRVLGTDGPFLSNAWTYVRGYGTDLLVPWALGPVALGLVLGARKWTGLRRLLLVQGVLLAVVLVLFLSRGRLVSTRYTIPVQPWLLTIAALALADLGRRIRGLVGTSKAWPAFAVALVVVPGFVASLDLAKRNSLRTGRYGMTDRLRELCTPGDRVATDWYGPLIPDTRVLGNRPEWMERLPEGTLHIRQHQIYDYIRGGMIPLPENGEPTDLVSLRAAGYRFVVMRVETWDKVARHPQPHPSLVAFLESLATLPEPERVGLENGEARYLIYSLN